MPGVEYKINMKHAMEILRAQNVTRKCKNPACGKPFALIGKITGQVVKCPECGTLHKIKQEVKFNTIIEALEV